MDTNQTDVELLHTAYDAFNARDIDAVLATMRPDVDWPNGWEGGYVHGHEEVRDYWTRQWSVVDPTVEPTHFDQEDAARILVTVHLVVRDASGLIQLDGYVGHRYTLVDGLIQTMEITEPHLNGQG